MVALGSINAWKPGRGPVTTWTASPASREIMAQADRDPLAPSLQQEQHLRTAYRAKVQGRDVPRLVMTAWDVDGWCDVAAMTVAINTHIRRHDAYHSAFEVGSAFDVEAGAITRRTVDDPNRLEFVPTVLGFMEEDDIRTHVATSTPGTLEWDCFSFGVIQKTDHFTVYANIDHLYTDGSSGVTIYRDINQAYRSLTQEFSNPLPQAARYRDYSARQRIQVDATTSDSRHIKDWIDFARAADGEGPGFALPLGDTEAGMAGRAVTVELLDARQTEAFDSACRAAGARFSGGVMACAALAEHALTGARSFHTFTPSDNRGPLAQSASAGWYASLFPVSVEIEDGEFGALARAAQKSFDTNKHLAAVPLQRALDLAAADGAEVKVSSRPSMMVSLFDFRKLDDANASGLGLYIDDLSHGDVNMWVSRNADQTIVMVSFPDTPEARHSVHHYLGVLRSAFVDAAQTAELAFAHSA